MEKPLAAFLVLALFLLLGCTGAEKEDIPSVRVYEATPASEAYGISETFNETALQDSGITLNESTQSQNSIPSTNPLPEPGKQEASQPPEKEQADSAPLLEPKEEPANIPEPKLVMHYFYSTICPFSPNASVYIRGLEEEYRTDLRVEWHNIYWNPANYSLYLNYSQASNITLENQVIPMAFIGNKSIGGQEIRERLGGEIEKSLQ